jgi:7-alpha-hydroxysteroid dehydrogenase
VTEVIEVAPRPWRPPSCHAPEVIQDRFRLDGQVAVVTGAGRGIGAATAIALAEAGADVVVSARTADDLAAVVAQVESSGRRARAVVADLSDLDAVAGLAGAAVDAFGRLDIVVNNVGGTMPRPFLDTSPRRLIEAFSFNVATAHALTRAAVPHMLEAGGGAVVGISSMMGRSAGRGFVAYGTAKAGLAHWTRLAAQDLAPPIRVNAIAVGSVATPALGVVLDDDDLRAQLERATPLRRIGDPEEVAATVLYLASAAGGYVTGKVLEVDGGIQAPNLDMGLPDL